MSVDQIAFPSTETDNSKLFPLEQLLSFEIIPKLRYKVPAVPIKLPKYMG